MPNFKPSDSKSLIQAIGKEKLLQALKTMLLIRNFEERAESAYQQGKIGGFFHSYSGQEAIQTALIDVCGKNHWFIDFYRCHALALLLGATPKEIMAELYGKSTGNAKGRGGSMHLYTDRMLGGFGIVGGQIPIGAGAAFSIKYLKKKGELSICFVGDGALAQGSFHEAMNMAGLWKLPLLLIIENNQWGMGTHVSRAIATSPLAEKHAPPYGMKSYTLDGMDYLQTYEGFQHIYKEMLQSGEPVMVECLCERFKGHSISDPGLYRSKEALQKVKERDPILNLYDKLLSVGFIDEAHYKSMDKEQKAIVIEAMDYAEKSPWPSPEELEQDVYAPN